MDSLRCYRSRSAECQLLAQWPTFRATKAREVSACWRHSHGRSTSSVAIVGHESVAPCTHWPPLVMSPGQLLGYCVNIYEKFKIPLLPTHQNKPIQMLLEAHGPMSGLCTSKTTLRRCEIFDSLQVHARRTQLSRSKFCLSSNIYNCSLIYANCFLLCTCILHVRVVVQLSTVYSGHIPNCTRVIL